MNKLTLAAATALGAAAISTAHAGANLQGPQLTGIALQSITTSQPTVTAVMLSSGETVVLRPQAAE